MTNAAIAWRIIRRVLLFAILGAVVGGVAGMIEGAGFGALCVTLWLWVEPTQFGGMSLGNLKTGTAFGAGFGLYLGAIAAGLAFAILGGILPPRVGWRDIWRRCTTRAVLWPIAGAIGGGLTGIMVFAAWNVLQSAGDWRAVLKDAFSLGGGFFFGSLAGFGLAMFIGILSGGLSGGLSAARQSSEARCAGSEAG